MGMPSDEICQYILFISTVKTTKPKIFSLRFTYYDFFVWQGKFPRNIIFIFSLNTKIQQTLSLIPYLILSDGYQKKTFFQDYYF